MVFWWNGVLVGYHGQEEPEAGGEEGPEGAGHQGSQGGKEDHQGNNCSSDIEIGRYKSCPY